MLSWIPAPVHRVGLRLAYGIRKRFRRFVKPDLAGVAVLLRDGDGRFLLVRHSYGPQGWAMPGGGLNRGEDPAEAARREMREELGCELDGLELLRSFEESFSGAQHVGHVFTARPSCDPRVDGRELTEARWFMQSELEALELTVVTKRRLKQLGYLAKASTG